jgi:hypothetical protein
MNKPALGPNEVLRTELIKLSLEQWHPSYFAQLQEEVRQVTNHIVRGRQDVKNARIAYAKKHGLVGDPPMFPTKPILAKPESEEDKTAVKQAWQSFRKLEK